MRFVVVVVAGVIAVFAIALILLNGPAGQLYLFRFTQPYFH